MRSLSCPLLLPRDPRSTREMAGQENQASFTRGETEAPSWLLRPFCCLSDPFRGGCIPLLFTLKAPAPLRFDLYLCVSIWLRSAPTSSDCKLLRAGAGSVGLPAASPRAWLEGVCAKSLWNKRTTGGGVVALGGVAAGGESAEPAHVQLPRSTPLPPFPPHPPPVFRLQNPPRAPPDAGNVGFGHQGALWARPPKGSSWSSVQRPGLTLGLSGQPGGLSHV